MAKKKTTEVVGGVSHSERRGFVLTDGAWPPCVVCGGRVGSVCYGFVRFEAVGLSVQGRCLPPVSGGCYGCRDRVCPDLLTYKEKGRSE